MFPMVWMLVAVVLGAGRWGTRPAGCGRWSVLGGFLCWFVVGEGVLGVVLGAGVAGVADGVSVGSGCFSLVRVLWRPVWVLVAVLVWSS